MNLKKSDMELAIAALFEIGDVYVGLGLGKRGAEYRDAALRFRTAVESARKNKPRRGTILKIHGAPQ